jgi:sugar lactone lactonase YvrE
MLTINNAGAVVGTAGLTGVGLGPEVAITPGALNMSIGGGVYGVTATPQSVTTAALSVSNNFSALAIDGSGNMYIADNINCLAYKVNLQTNQIVVIAGNYTFAAGAVTPSTTPIPALGSNTCPIAIAVDGAGNVFIVDANIAVNDAGTYNSAYPGVVEEVSAATGEIIIVAGNPNSSLTATTTPQPALSVAIQAVNSLTTDAAGNLYISDFFNNLVEKVTPDGNIVVVAGGGGPGGPFTTPQLATNVSLNGPTGMVVDASGNLYISDQNISLIEMVNAAGQISTVAGGGGSAPSTTPQPALNIAISAPGELAVDGAGNLYIADIFNYEIEQVNLTGQLVVVAGGGATVPTATVQSSLAAHLGAIQGVEVDGAGNIYIADGQNIGNGDNMIEKVGTLPAPLNFPFTNVGSSSPPQSLNLTNIGNQSLTLSSVSVAADYPLQTTGSCTVTASSGQTLPSSNNCSLTYVFDPNNGGVLDEAAIVTDNNLNAVNAQQTLSLTGTATGGTLATPTVTVTLLPSSITTAEALTATIGVSEGSGSPMVTGSVTLTGGAYTSPAAQLVSGTVQINVPVGSLAAGTYPLTVTYVPDANSSATYLNATGTAPVTVVPASFTISGTMITVASGATTGNTSTITVTPAGWFSGTISLTCAIAPVAANDPATCSIQPASITLNGTTAITTTLTATTTGTTSSINPSNKLFWPSAGGAALALVFLFGIPARRRNWRTMLGMALLLLAICCVVPGCGGTPSNSTPPGLYSVTVTGTSGGTSSTGYVVLKVQ